MQGPSFVPFGLQGLEEGEIVARSDFALKGLEEREGGREVSFDGERLVNDLERELTFLFVEVNSSGIGSGGREAEVGGGRDESALRRRERKGGGRRTMSSNGGDWRREIYRSFNE